MQNKIPSKYFSLVTVAYYSVILKYQIINIFMVSEMRSVRKTKRNPRGAGRKPRFSKAELQDIIAQYRAYIVETDIPVVSEFAYRMKIPRHYLYGNEELREVTDWLVLKKSAALERGMVTGTLPVAGCIFALKQLGWKDHQEVETVVIDKKKIKKELERLFE